MKKIYEVRISYLAYVAAESESEAWEHKYVIQQEGEPEIEVKPIQRLDQVLWGPHSTPYGSKDAIEKFFAEVPIRAAVPVSRVEEFKALMAANGFKLCTGEEENDEG